MCSADESGGSAAQRHGRAGLQLRHEMHHVNTNKCHSKSGGSSAFPSLVLIPKCVLTFPYGQGAVSSWEKGGMEGSTPSTLSFLATAAPLGSPELPVTPCCPWSPHHGDGANTKVLPLGGLGIDTAGKMYGAML